MQVNDEYDFAILKRAEEILNEKFNWQIKDDEMTGYVNEDVFSIIEELCDEIDYIKEQNEVIEEEDPRIDEYIERKKLGI